ncbi:hypothetical protein J7L67_04230, partial [bacterium]|nr:hypothetical protein [bacterium]
KMTERDPIKSIISQLESGLMQLTGLLSIIEEQNGNICNNIETPDEYTFFTNQIIPDSEDITRICELYLSKMEYIEGKVNVSSKEIEEIISGADILTEKNKQNTSSIKKLEKFSGQIKDMAKAVIKISKQTNMLSYNVAIEASHAIEESKAFTVLSEEIRKLAETSGNSAKDITKLTQQLQKNVKKIITDVQNTGETISKELKEIKSIILTFNEITDRMKHLYQNGRKMKLLSRDVLKGSREIHTITDRLFSLQNQVKLKLENLIRLINRQIRLQTQTIALGKELYSQNRTQHEFTQQFIEQCHIIHETSSEIERQIEDLFYSFGIINSADSQFKSNLDNMAHKISSINLFSKKDENQLQHLMDSLKNDFSKVTNIVEYIQNMFFGSSSVIKNSQKVNEGSWNINHIVDMLINLTTITKMLSINASLESTRLEKSEYDCEGVVNDLMALSEQSAQTVDSIKINMQQIGNLISSVLMDINDTAYSSTHVLEKVKRVMNNIRVIQQSIESSSDLIMEICIFSGTIMKNLDESQKIIVGSKEKRNFFINEDNSLKNTAGEISVTLNKITPSLRSLSSKNNY